MQYFGSNNVEGIAESWVEAEISWVEVNWAGWRLKWAGWRWMEVDGGRWNWVEVGVQFSNTLKINLSWKVPIISGMRVKNSPPSPLKKNLKKTLNFQSTLPEVFLKNAVLESLLYLACNFLKKTLAQLFFYKFCEFSEWLLLSIAIICQEYFKLNVRRIRATIFWSLTSSF